jgi:hypothetical protein
MKLNIVTTARLKEALLFYLDNLLVEPQAIVMSPEFHKTLNKPSGMRGVQITVDQSAKTHWRLKF